MLEDPLDTKFNNVQNHLLKIAHFHWTFCRSMCRKHDFGKSVEELNKKFCVHFTETIVQTMNHSFMQYKFTFQRNKKK